MDGLVVVGMKSRAAEDLHFPAQKLIDQPNLAAAGYFVLYMLLPAHSWHGTMAVVLINSNCCVSHANTVLLWPMNVDDIDNKAVQLQARLEQVLYHHARMLQSKCQKAQGLCVHNRLHD